MKVATSSLVLALSLIGFNAHADSVATIDANYPGAFPTSTQQLTRDQVRAELAQAKAEGKTFNDATYPGAFPTGNSLSREQVRAELAQAKAQGVAFNDATYPTPGRVVAHVSKSDRTLLASSTNGKTSVQ